MPTIILPPRQTATLSIIIFKSFATSVHILSYRRWLNGFEWLLHTQNIGTRHWLIEMILFKQRVCCCRGLIVHHVKFAVTKSCHLQSSTPSHPTFRRHTIRAPYLQAHRTQTELLTITSRVGGVQPSSSRFVWCWLAYLSCWFRRCR